MIPSIDLEALSAQDRTALDAMAEAATGIGFATVHNTALEAAQVRAVIETYREFFRLPERDKAGIDMARTGANRGWGASGSEQVDPDANPDYKQFFDSGVTLTVTDSRREMPVYAPNIWPAEPVAFASPVAPAWPIILRNCSSRAALDASACSLASWALRCFSSAARFWASAFACLAFSALSFARFSLSSLAFSAFSLAASLSAARFSASSFFFLACAVAMSASRVSGGSGSALGSGAGG